MWILVLFLSSTSTGTTAVSIPGFQSETMCEAGGKKLFDRNVRLAMTYDCIQAQGPAPKKSKEPAKE